MKTRIGVIFGGASREREISFAGGRTVYDNLDKALFDPVPVFIDSFGNFILMNWEFIYKGSIRDFYPHPEQVPPSPNDYQVYAESLGELALQDQLKLIHKIGTRIEPSSLSGLIDFAFLCLHGSDGEDGRIQGLLEYYRIPYSGSGILSSCIGMNKAMQKEWMKNAGFTVPAYQTIRREDWFSSNGTEKEINNRLEKIKFPCVVKAANQGSSIGISVLRDSDPVKFKKAVEKSFFTYRLTNTEWQALTFDQKIEFVRTLTDIREGIGIPVKISSKIIFHPEELLSNLNQLFSEPEEEILIESIESESEVIIEEFITGKEFSCIVIENLDGIPVALPPTEIRKGKELFDYRSKYLPGLSRKITPINLPDADIQRIRTQCQQLFTKLAFNVYARIDGFITPDGTILLNDPNTTSGMLPSSFFFHQAAEIGLNPSQFITYIIRASLVNRVRDIKSYKVIPWLLQHLDRNITSLQSSVNTRKKIAVIMGGYSSERHISVESGRNIYEKLSSSDRYQPVPVFLSGNDKAHQLHVLPINVLLKDNADDIREKVEHFERHTIITQIMNECAAITSRYAAAGTITEPLPVTYEELAKMVDGVFIALHGRPGEDGVVQSKLERVGLPYNGSGVVTSQITIDKFATNELLMKNGLHAAHHRVVTETEWRHDPSALEESLLKEFNFPFIAKPVDDGCSSAVKIIRNENELHAFAELIFRKTEELVPAAATLLKIKPKEEFPNKNCFLIEELVTKKGASRFLEVTGGLLTYYDEKGNLEYEVFEASEALSEGDVLSLEEKFLAGQGQNITPARYSKDQDENRRISSIVKEELEKAARVLKVEGYARIDAFVRIFENKSVEVLIIEVNSLPGMTPATCIFHQAAINHYKPYEFIDKLIDFGFKRTQLKKADSRL
ncbi:MAG: D-alanine--D-alanine ligase [Bacteroidetes bacterium]|nr:D-alanine--D-alanine ligase [Bacteroidota bacterium]